MLGGCDGADGAEELGDDDSVLVTLKMPSRAAAKFRNAQDEFDRITFEQMVKTIDRRMIYAGS